MVLVQDTVNGCLVTCAGPKARESLSASELSSLVQLQPQVQSKTQCHRVNSEVTMDCFRTCETLCS